MDWDSVRDKLSSLGEGAGRFAKRLVGSENEREVRKLAPLLQKINGLEAWAQGLDRDAMQAKIQELKASVAAGKATLDDCMPEVFALTREASQRTLGLRHYDVQLVGGYVLHSGKIAEMMTGEGKTLMATLALALNALSGRPCYLCTVNDYLARRDAEWMRPIYEYLGLRVASIQSTLMPWERHDIYAADIVYSTNNELGFDYLRDNMKTRREEQVQKDLYFCIVDEVDSILIDEARTPLIISGPAEDHVGRYREADVVARQLVRDEHYEVKEKERQASLTEEGIVRSQELLGVESFYVPGFEDWPHYLENALRAHSLYERDKEYVVEEGEDQRTGQVGTEVVIVDEFTGRKMPGRRWSDGLHQAVEVKEGLVPKQETQTLATITFQNYFRMFDKLAGMTGTALTEAGEFHKIYKLDVVSVPTNRPLVRKDHVDVVYRTEPEKWKAICDEIAEVQTTGQPILVGTTSVENSQKLSNLLKERGLSHEVLNAKNHEREAHIVAMAGAKNSVTVSTNMAGRGTDIKLGGNFEFRLEQLLNAEGLELGNEEHLERIEVIRKKLREEADQDEAEILAIGGLYVLGTERHEARRIDNQLRGRSGRQGNDGATRFFLSLQDPLMRIFYRDWVTNAMERLGMKEGIPIESGMVARAIERAQRKVEERNFEIRKSLLEYDEVMDHQRTEIYSARQAVLEGEDLRERVEIMIANVVARMARVYSGDGEGFKDWALRTFGIELPESVIEPAVHAKNPVTGAVLDLLRARYEERVADWGPELTSRVQNYLVLTAIDQKWKDHLHAMDALKAGIGLRGYGQQDPKIAYKKEASEMFAEQLLPAIEADVASKILRIEVQRPAPAPAPAEVSGDGPASAGAEAPAPAAADGLTPRGMVRAMPAGPGQAQGQQPRRVQIDPSQLTPEQLAQVRKAIAAQQAREDMRRAPSATNAFDVMRRRQALLEQQQRAAAAQQAAQGDGQPGEAGAQAAPAGAASAAPSQPRSPVPAGTPAGAFEGVGRNDVCPCGSGKKFKKCHGQ